jgi:regulator of sigma E protease
MIIHELIKQLAVIGMGVGGVGFLIAFHELGHFIACKIFGVATPQFSIGFGPKLVSFRALKTLFSLSAVPLGGFVEIAQEGHDVSLGRPFSALNWLQKMIIISGGIIFNLIFSFIALTLVFLTDTPASPFLYPFNSSTQVKSVLPDSPAARAEITPGSYIKKINEIDILDDSKKLSVTLAEHRGKKIKIQFENNNGQFDATVSVPDMARPRLGVEFDFKTVPAAPSLLIAAQRSLIVCKELIYNLLSFLKSLITCKSTQGIGGPVLIFSEAIKGVREGMATFLILLAFISINLAVMNLVPLPVLDGGQALIATLETIIQRPLSETIRTILFGGAWLLLVALAVYLSITDIVVIFSKCLP